MALGAQYLITEIPAPDVFRTTAADIEQALLRAVQVADAGGSYAQAKADHFLKAILGSHLRPIHSGVAVFLGESSETLGGTVFNPVQVPEWMRLLQDRLERTLRHVRTSYFTGPPFNQRELQLQWWRLFLWHIVEFHD